MNFTKYHYTNYIMECLLKMDIYGYVYNKFQSIWKFWNSYMEIFFVPLPKFWNSEKFHSEFRFFISKTWLNLGYCGNDYPTYILHRKRQCILEYFCIVTIFLSLFIAHVVFLNFRKQFSVPHQSDLLDKIKYALKLRFGSRRFDWKKIRWLTRMYHSTH